MDYKKLFKIKTSQFLLVEDKDSVLTIKLSDKADKLSTVFEFNCSLKQFLQQAARTLDIDDYKLALNAGDENYYLFPARNFNDLLTLLENVKQKEHAKIPLNLSEKISTELKQNLNYDLLASVFDAALENILMNLNLILEELQISDVAFYGEMTDIARFRKVLDQQLKLNGINTYFPIPEKS